jgi:type IV pilus assembly protein PilW
MIAMLVGMVVLYAVYEAFTVQSKVLGTQDYVVEMQQNARMGMEMMTREIKMAGYYPNSAGVLPKCTGTTPTPANTPCVGILNASNNLLQFNLDILNP